MFKVSTKGDYGLLLLAALAEKRQTGARLVSLKEIAKEKKLSLPYISRIITLLKKAGLVESKEGKNGGYSLAKNPREISLMQILEVLEGPVSLVKCCSNAQAKCVSESFCGIKQTWQAAKGLLTAFLRSATLEDIARPRRKTQKTAGSPWI